MSKSRESSVGDGWSPVFLEGEDRADYDRLLAKVTAGVKPRDVLEEIWIGDVVYLVWEARRYRRLKDHLLRSSARHGLLEILEPLIREIGENDPIRALYGAISAEALVKDWYANDEKARSQVDALLKKAGLTMDDVMAQALALKMTEIEQINRMIALAEGRRNAALREVDRHRKALADQLKLAAEEAEFEEVPAPTEPQRHHYG